MNININKFIENNTHIDKDEKAIVKFGIDMMISTIMAFITAIIISAVLGMLKEGIVFLISIIVLRQYAGGYHTNSQRSCAVLSCVIYSAGLMVIKSYKVRIFLSSEVVIFVLLLIKANEYWSGIIAISMMIVAILVLAGFIENRIRG